MTCLHVTSLMFHLGGVFATVLHQAPSQQTRHCLQFLLSLLDVGVQLEDLLEVAAGRQVVLPPKETPGQYR